ncbi:YlbF family regulator [Loigolactobacillus zhaoyuanensis]|uniref:UPF0342 protein ACEN34_00380 n=1 Tax=Loigolactobacillus zhaoyuanensis TaxID=2486017 RepID=A0ABW8UB70_9LACO|nr:YlbF family regulator [Loigolactobacillus zhaoyuanensis]
MAVNVYDTANKLEGELRQIDEFVALQATYDAMKQNKTAYDMFKQFQKVNIELQQKQMQGQELTDAEINKAHELADKVGKFDEVQALMEKEKAMSQIMDDLNQIITKPVQELYAN